ncbi:MAG: hypothetical protein IJ880_10635, partial [Bacilli bacterium]|nr:hypothetical protein [Bacilli bacterium]
CVSTPIKYHLLLIIPLISRTSPAIIMPNATVIGHITTNPVTISNTANNTIINKANNANTIIVVLLS